MIQYFRIEEKDATITSMKTACHLEQQKNIEDEMNGRKSQRATKACNRSYSLPSTGESTSRLELSPLDMRIHLSIEEWFFSTEHNFVLSNDWKSLPVNLHQLIDGMSSQLGRENLKKSSCMFLGAILLFLDISEFSP